MPFETTRRRNANSVFHGDDAAEEEISYPTFCKDIRKFKDYSRELHEFFAQTDGALYPRKLDRKDNDLSLRIVRDAVQYPKRYESRDDLSDKKKAEYTDIVNEILDVSEKMVGKSGEVTLEIVILTVYIYGTKDTVVVPLFKVYGKKRGDFVFISKERKQYDTLLHFLDECDLPHSLVCAAREGSEKTYEIDSVIKKYPLEFFTVHYSRYIDCWEENIRVWSTIYKHSMYVDIPFYSIWGLMQCAHNTFKHLLYKVNLNEVQSTVKRKFLKFAEIFVDYLPAVGSLLNETIILAVCFSFYSGFIDKNELKNALILKMVEVPQSMLMRLTFREGDNSSGDFQLAQDYHFQELISDVMNNKVDSGTINICLDVLQKLLEIGISVLETSTNPLARVCLYVGLKIGLYAVRYVIQLCDAKSKPKNYLEEGTGRNEETPTVDNGNYTLCNFLKTYKKEDIKNQLLDEECRRSIDSITKICDADHKHCSQIIPIESDADLFISLTPIFVTIESLLEKSHQNARVYASEDGSLYEISLEEALYKIYPRKDDKLHQTIQIIHMEKK